MSNIEHLFSERGLEAYRQLYIADNIPLLMSGSHFVWEPGKRVESSPKACTGWRPPGVGWESQIGVDMNTPHPRLKNCSCGIYSYKEERYLYGVYIQYPHVTLEGNEFIQCVATLRLSGRVIRAQYGYRSQYAQVAAIKILYNKEENEYEAMVTAMELGEAYKVPSHHERLNVDHEWWRYNPITGGGFGPATPSPVHMTLEKLQTLWANRDVIKMDKPTRRFTREQLYRRLYERKQRAQKAVTRYAKLAAESKTKLAAITAEMEQLLKEH